VFLREITRSLSERHDVSWTDRGIDVDSGLAASARPAVLFIEANVRFAALAADLSVDPAVDCKQRKQ